MYGVARARDCGRGLSSGVFVCECARRDGMRVLAFAHVAVAVCIENVKAHMCARRACVFVCGVCLWLFARRCVSVRARVRACVWMGLVAGRRECIDL